MGKLSSKRERERERERERRIWRWTWGEGSMLFRKGSNLETITGFLQFSLR
jgi:hypothetical protein